MSRPPLLGLVLTLCLALAGCGGGGGVSGAPTEKLRVLFIGNSLTYWNDMPSILRAVSKAAGGPHIAWRMHAEPNYALFDHMLDDRLRVRLEEGGWDYVVMQQGPSALPESRVQLRADVATLSESIRAGGAEPAIYQVWPEFVRRDVFPDVLESYRLAAEDVGGRLLPAGEAWQAAWALDPTLPLYSDDDFHPSVHGSYLVALVIYEGLTGRSATGIPGALRVEGYKRPLPISDAHAALLQRAAEQVRRPRP